MPRTAAVLSILLLFFPAALPAQTSSVGGPGEGELFQDRTARQPVPGPYVLTPQALSVVIEPFNPPITIPQGGGVFNYSISATNGEENPETFDVWTVATLPNGNPYGPVLGQLEFLLPGGWSTGRDDLSQYVPGFAPAGMYTYTANVGSFPSQVLGSDSFTLEKLGVGAGWYEQSPNTSYNLLALGFIDTETGWAVGYETIVHTTDGRVTWAEQQPDGATSTSSTPARIGLMAECINPRRASWSTPRRGENRA